MPSALKPQPSIFCSILRNAGKFGGMGSAAIEAHVRVGFRDNFSDNVQIPSFPYVVHAN